MTQQGNKALSAKDTMALLGISRSTFYRYVRNHSLPALHVGFRSAYRVDPDALRRWASRNEKEGKR